MNISKGGTGHFCGSGAKPASIVYNNGLAESYFALCGVRINKVKDENWTFYEQFVTCKKCQEKLKGLDIHKELKEALARF